MVIVSALAWIVIVSLTLATDGVIALALLKVWPPLSVAVLVLSVVSIFALVHVLDGAESRGGRG